MENSSLSGKVKFYNKDKGFGFIYCSETNKDYYFAIKNVNNGDIPGENDIVTFEYKETPKGLTAINVTVTSKGEASNSSSDSRVKCESCGKLMVPRIVFFQGFTDHSVCPFCGSRYKTFTNPFWFIFLGMLVLVAIMFSIFFM